MGHAMYVWFAIDPFKKGLLFNLMKKNTSSVSLDCLPMSLHLTGKNLSGKNVIE